MSLSQVLEYRLGLNMIKHLTLNTQNTTLYLKQMILNGMKVILM